MIFLKSLKQLKIDKIIRPTASFEIITNQSIKQTNTPTERIKRTIAHLVWWNSILPLSSLTIKVSSMAKVRVLTIFPFYGLLSFGMIAILRINQERWLGIGRKNVISETRLGLAEQPLPMGNQEVLEQVEVRAATRTHRRVIKINDSHRQGCSRLLQFFLLIKRESDA